MQDLIATYQEHLHLHSAHFTRIDHEDAMVATVFRVVADGVAPLILKICSRPGDYLREVHFLKHFSKKVPVPRILQLVPPEPHLDGAILMQCLPGRLLTIEDLTDALCHETGSLLARIHLERVQGYGDLTDPTSLKPDPRVPFTLKFEEGLKECEGHLPAPLLEQCRRYYDQHVDMLLGTDGPCIIHRDFRPGNLIIDQGEIQGIIDWSSARGGFAEEDFCPLECGEWSANPSCKEAFLAGYAAIRKVPSYAHLLLLLRLSRAVAAIGFTVKRGTWQGRGAKLYRAGRQYLDSIFANDLK